MNIRKSYPSDLTDEPWQLIQPLLPKPCPRGAPIRVRRRDIRDAIFYLLRTGCQWRQLPPDLPPWGTVASQFHRWRAAGVWEQVHHALHAQARQQEGKSPRPTAGI